MIDLLYQASKSGVKIDLIVRGICCLVPGVPGFSEHITVRSIIGRFLEHSRVFYFYNDGQEDIFLSSADWMPRNLDRRVELMFPVESADAWQQVKDVLEIQLKDTDRAWLLASDGAYARVDRRGKKSVDSQAALCRMAEERAAAEKGDGAEVRFMPVEKSDDDAGE
jgi:polyphosphate kinase